MVRSTIRSLAEGVPRNGLALHGTTFEKAQEIRQSGLQHPEGGPSYFCPLPFRGGTMQMPESEVLERVIGSGLFASNHSFKGFDLTNHLPQENLPAIVIFKGKPGGHFYGSYEQEKKRDIVRGDGRDARLASYRSFGKQVTMFIPAEQVAQVVHITPQEHGELRRRYGKDGGTIYEKMKLLLVSKTLGALREVIEAEAISRNKS